MKTFSKDSTNCFLKKNTHTALFKKPKMTTPYFDYLKPGEINPTFKICSVNAQHSIEHMPEVLKNIGDLLYLNRCLMLVSYIS